MNKKFVTMLWIFIGGLIFCAGCGTQKPNNFPDIVPCSIFVTSEQKPVDKTLVTLAPVSGGGEWISSGLTNSSGTAEIATILGSYSAKGAPEGEFKIFLSRPIEIKLNVSQEDAINMSEEEREKLRKETDRLTKEARVIPEKFESIVTTPVKISISKNKAIYRVELNDYNRNLD
jgi:hypothetical protein